MSNSVIEAFKGLKVASAQDASDHEAIFEVSYQYLSKIKNFRDLEAFHNCIVSLINSDKYYRALQLIDEVPEDIHVEYPLEKAYVYYKTGKTDLLAQVYQATLDAEDVNDILLRGMKHVVAQSYYQTGNYEAALQLYLDFITNNNVDGEVDLACNERAILSQIGFRSGLAVEPKLVVDPSTETYDIVFNNALIQLKIGSYAESMRLLEAALAQCSEQNLDSDPSELILEIAPIKLTIAYIHQLMGNVDEAIAVLDSLDLAQITDPLLQLLIKNNYRSLQTNNPDPNFVARELDYQHNFHLLRQKLTPKQHQLLLKNHLALSYQSKTLSKSSKYFTNRFYKEFSLQFPGDITPLIYKILVKLDITPEDLESARHTSALSRKIFKFASAEREKDSLSLIPVAAVILLIHVNSQSGNFGQPIALLEKMASTAFSSDENFVDGITNGTVFGLLNGLFVQTESFRRNSEFWQNLLSQLCETSLDALRDNAHFYGIVRSVAFHYLDKEDAEEVKGLLDKLHAARPEDAVVGAAVGSDVGVLLPLESLASDKSIEDLLAVDVESLVPVKVTKAVSAPRKTAEHKITKKTRKPKFSKHKFYKPDHEFDPLKDLNQERWLPLKLRSNYKPTKKDLKKRAGGHQGVVESSPAPSSAPQPTSGPSKSKSKSKKKKGKK